MLLYALRNRTTEKVYIGITSRSGHTRFAEHVKAARADCLSHRYLYRAMRKYGPDCWAMEEIATAATWQELCEMEIEAIDLYRSNNRFHGYNSTAGGDGVRGFSRKGKIVSPATRAKISAALKGKPKTAEHMAKSLSTRRAMNFKKTPEQKEKSARFHRGRKRSPETIAKMVAAWQRRKNGDRQCRAI